MSLKIEGIDVPRHVEVKGDEAVQDFVRSELAKIERPNPSPRRRRKQSDDAGADEEE